ncbi:MAG: hypothetical protein Q9159_004178 [Coniocarpon cinnabarinum]
MSLESVEKQDTITKGSDPPELTLHQVYQNLPFLATAAERITEPIKETIHGIIRPVFLKHGTEKKYGLSLLHRHFDIRPLVRYADNRPNSHGAGFVTPISYRFTGAKAVPFEFAYSPTPCDATLCEKESQFFAELSQLLHRLGFEDLFGIQITENFDPYYCLETTINRSNVMIHPYNIPEGRRVEACWMFTSHGEDDNTPSLEISDQSERDHGRNRMCSHCLMAFCDNGSELHKHDHVAGTVSLSPDARQTSRGSENTDVASSLVSMSEGTSPGSPPKKISMNSHFAKETSTSMTEIATSDSSKTPANEIHLSETKGEARGHSGRRPTGDCRNCLSGRCNYALTTHRHGAGRCA